MFASLAGELGKAAFSCALDLCTVDIERGEALCERERGRVILCSVFFYSVPSSSLSIPSFLSPQILHFFSFFLLNFVVSRKDVLCNNAVQSKGMNGKMGVKNMGLRMLNW